MRRTFFADNNLSSAVALIGQVLEFLRAQSLTPRSLYIAELALEEMLTNIVKYAHDDNGDAHRIELIADVGNGRVLLELHDDGHPFDPSRVTVAHPGVPVAERAQGGYGIQLVRKLVDQFDYRRDGAHNILQLGFSAAAPETSPAK